MFNREAIMIGRYETDLREADANLPDDTHPQTLRKVYVIENVGYPLTLFVALTVDEDQVTDDYRIVQIDLYADAERQQLVVDDVPLTRFSEETREDIVHALYGKICSERDAAAFSKRIDEIQAALR
jgi:hypothetical protein